LRGAQWSKSSLGVILYLESHPIHLHPIAALNLKWLQYFNRRQSVVKKVQKAVCPFSTTLSGHRFLTLATCLELLVPRLMTAFYLNNHETCLLLNIRHNAKTICLQIKTTFHTVSLSVQYTSDTFGLTAQNFFIWKNWKVYVVRLCVL
jgi:hypothetical protein